MRNIGGSFGIAIATTVLSRGSQFFQTELGSRFNSFETKFTMSMENFKAVLIARGVDGITAEKQATAMMCNNIRRHAAMLSCNHLFWYVGLTSIGIIPLLLLKNPRIENT